MIKVKTITFGEHLRMVRENAGLTLRQVANSVSIDVSLLAKIERNERPPTKQLINTLANFFNIEKEILFEEFLSDQIAYKILNENANLKILKVAEKKVSYLKSIRDV
jgi:transcriptional regulator with XRE-family HTH domain